MANEVEAQHVAPLSTSNLSLQVKDFIWSEDEWPHIKHDDFAATEDIPVISLLFLSKENNKNSNKEYEEECRKMVMASRQWGFFKLVDHGVADEVIAAMKGRLSELFDLPMDEKMKGGRREGVPLGYSASNPDYVRNLPWAEVLQLFQSSDQVVGFAKKVYGDQHQHFSEAVMKYLEELDRLGLIIFEMLAHGLGLPDDYFTNNFHQKESAILRVNQYPPCPLPEKCLGLGSHTDPHALTILLQDDKVGGLQVLKSNGEWIGIRPIPNSFIINIGDVLEAWTNARLKSVIHRAIVNKEKKRLSVAYFMCPSGDTLIDCPLQLLDNEANSRRKYTAFTWNEFKMELLKQKRVVGKTALNRYLIHYPN